MFLDHFRKKTTGPEFEERTLPWADRGDFDKQLKKRCQQGKIPHELGRDLCDWNRDGFLIWPGAVDASLIDRLLEDYERGWQERPECELLVSGQGLRRWSEIGPRSAAQCFRITEFHHFSEAAAEIMMHPRVLRFMELLFEEVPVGMQTLFFEYGSEQGLHQDFAYVRSGILSHLAASWVACEDVDETNGPLIYYPGSHKIPKFDFGNGRLIYDFKKRTQSAGFLSHLKLSCDRAGLKPQTLCAKKGDLLLWHSALVHGGSPVLDRTRTRKSLVSHYSDIKAYPIRRARSRKVSREREMNGGVFYVP